MTTGRINQVPTVLYIYDSSSYGHYYYYIYLSLSHSLSLYNPYHAAARVCAAWCDQDTQRKRERERESVRACTHMHTHTHTHTCIHLPLSHFCHHSCIQFDDGDDENVGGVSVCMHVLCV